jgi:hypothetical protein
MWIPHDPNHVIRAYRVTLARTKHDRRGAAHRHPVLSVRPAVAARGPRDRQSAHTWCADWRVIITVLGWLTTIGGIIRIVVPRIAVAVGTDIDGGRANTIVATLIIGTLGAFLSFKGYVQRDFSF